MSDLLKPGIHFGITREQYVADPGINQSALKAFERAKTPFHYKYERDNPPDQDKDFLRIGSAFDMLVWSPEEYKRNVVVAPPTYPCKATAKDPRTEKPWTLKSGWCQEWWEEVKEAGKLPLTVDERASIIGMVAGMESNQDVPGILQNCERHVVIIANHPSGYRLKGELDLWPKTHSAALGQWYFELKTDGQGADDPSFHEKCYKVGYVKQIAFYLMIGRLVGFENLESCGVIVQESFAPFQCKIHYAKWYDEDVVKEREWIEEWLPKYAACVSSGNWPSYPSDWSRIQYPGWARKGKYQGEAEVLT